MPIVKQVADKVKRTKNPSAVEPDKAIQYFMHRDKFNLTFLINRKHTKSPHLITQNNFSSCHTVIRQCESVGICTYNMVVISIYSTV